jgi:hypothetical protein
MATSTTGLAAAVALCVFTVVALKAQGGGAPVERERRLYDEVTFGRLQARAREAKGHQPAAVRALVDEIFDGNMIIRGAPMSLRERVSTTDLAMRSGTGTGVRLVDAVAGINDAVRRAGLPHYFRTTEAQIQSFRNDYRYVARDLALPGLALAGAESMSPNEALFIIAEMALQKVLVEENRIAPEAWDQRRRQREADLERASRSGGAKKQPSSSRLTAQVRGPEESFPVPDLSSEDSAGTLELHRLLDALGFQR